MIYLETERLIIRDPAWPDLPGWHKLMSDPKTMYFVDDIMTRSEEESRQNLSEAISDIANPNRTKYFLAMQMKNNGDFIGTIGYTVINDTPVGKLVGAGYFILPEYHNKGYTTEALRELLRFAFEDNNVYRFETGCMVENRASEKVMQKCGLIRESYKKDCVWHDGRFKDRVSYRLLRQEWQAGFTGNNCDFWQALDRLVSESQIVIDRPKGSRHPKYPDCVYPLDYGYLENTLSTDGGGIDVWKGTDGDYVDAVIVTLDLGKKDSEIKILAGCSEDEKQLVLAAHNGEYQKGILIRR